MWIHCLSKSIQRVAGGFVFGVFLKSILDIYPSIFLQTFFSVPFFLFSSGIPITHMFYHLILSQKSLRLCSLVNFFLSVLQFQWFLFPCPRGHRYFLLRILSVINPIQRIFGLAIVFFGCRISISPNVSISSWKFFKIVFIIVIYKFLFNHSNSWAVYRSVSIDDSSLDYEPNSLVSSQV